MTKFVGKDDLDKMMKGYYNSNDNLRLIIEKNCGYNFLVVLPNNATLRDLSRQIELIYSHINRPLNLYYGEIYVRNNEQKVNNDDEVNNDQDNVSCDCCKLKTNSGKKHYIKPCDDLIKKFINSNNIIPCTNEPNKVYYKFYLDICK